MLVAEGKAFIQNCIFQAHGSCGRVKKYSPILTKLSSVRSLMEQYLDTSNIESVDELSQVTRNKRTFKTNRVPSVTPFSSETDDDSSSCAFHINAGGWQ
ncbi:unnamed protein product [Allacma fusca]|uniref:Uncharacterized protein n=1 Tax=Allacma fusca TaxID=39272 RepID=A0A8J2KYH9_9HEXA|nr:unnamed protein product [Allacma fusca]